MSSAQGITMHDPDPRIQRPPREGEEIPYQPLPFPDSSSPCFSPRPGGIQRRLLHHALGLVLVAGFSGVQYVWWLDGRRYRMWFEPSPVLGPLYFLANASSGDDWLGIVLLAVLVPCVLAFPVWPTRWTAVLTVSAILAWMGPGILLTRTP